MSSALLYAAIVAVWAIVLVPMWLRRDGEGLSRLLHRRSEAEFDDSAGEETAPEPPVRRPGRAAVIARRRRRTLGFTLLLVASIATVATGLTPWWFVFPAIALLGAHLALLRVAVKIDAEQRAARREAAMPERRIPEPPAPLPDTAEIIAMPERPVEEVYDQYTDLRAVGD